jgi:hypothetical protein
MSNEIDRLFMEGHVKQLCDTMEKLGNTISAQGIGVSIKLDTATVRLANSLDATAGRLGEKIDRASDRLLDAVEKASTASERYAKGLVHATWALVGTTIVLVLITAANVYVVAK